MIPILYEKNETKFETNGLGLLTEAVSCIVQEERNGAFELELEYPNSGRRFKDLTLSRIIYAEPGIGREPQPFEIYDITQNINGTSTYRAWHISYRLSYIPVKAFSADSVKETMEYFKSNSVEENPFTFWTDIDNGGESGEIPSTVSRGDSGSTVELLQQKLTDLGYGYIVGDVDGIFGYNTERGVIQYQNDNNLTADGICGPSTWGKLLGAKPFKIDVPTSIRDCIGADEEKSLLAISKGEIEWDKFNVKLHQKRGVNSGTRIAYGKNLTNLEREISSEETVTGIYPFWSTTSDDETSITDADPVYSENSGDFAYKRTVVLDCSGDFEEEPSETQLQDKARAEFKKETDIWKPVDNFTISFISLSSVEEYKKITSLEKLSVCDEVVVDYPGLDVSATLKVITTKYDVLKGRMEEIEVGIPKSTLEKTLTSSPSNFSGGEGTGGGGIVVPVTNLVLKGNGSGGIVVAQPNRDYITPDGLGDVVDDAIEEVLTVPKFKMVVLKNSASDGSSDVSESVIYICGTHCIIEDFGYSANLTYNYIINHNLIVDAFIISHFHADHVAASSSASMRFDSCIDNLISNQRLNPSTCIAYLPHGGLTGYTVQSELKYIDANTTGSNKTDSSWGVNKNLCGASYGWEPSAKYVLNKLFSVGIHRYYPYDGETIELLGFPFTFYNTDQDKIDAEYDFEWYEQNALHGYHWDSPSGTVTADGYSIYNNFSMPVSINVYGKKILNPGDLMMESQDLNRNIYDNVDVYVVEHHGLNALSGEYMLSVLNPEVAVCPSSKDSSPLSPAYYGRATLSRLIDVGCPIYHTMFNNVEIDILPSGAIAKPDQRTLLTGNMVGHALGKNVADGQSIAEIVTPGRYNINYQVKSLVTGIPSVFQPIIDSTYGMFRLEVDLSGFNWGIITQKLTGFNPYNSSGSARASGNIEILSATRTMHMSGSYISDWMYASEGMAAWDIDTVSYTTVTVSSGSGTALCSITVPKGLCAIQGIARFGASSGSGKFNDIGDRELKISNTSGDVSYGMEGNLSVYGAANSAATVVEHTLFVKNDSDKTYYLNVWQNSGSSMTCYGKIKVIKIH